MRSAWWLGLALVALLAPVASAHPQGTLEVVPFDETIPAGAAVDGSPTSLSPHGNITVPEDADRVHLRLAWTPTAGTDPAIRLAALDGPSTPFENRTIAAAVGHSPLALTVDVEDVDLLGWRVRAHDGLAADQDVQGLARFETSPPAQPTSPPASTPAEHAGQPAPGTASEPGATVLAASLATLAAAVVAALRRPWGPIQGLLAGLYSRISDEEVADHPERRRILALLDEEPGLHLAGLERRVDLSEATLRHHLGKLVDADLLVRWATDGYVCYFRPGSALHEREALARLRSPTAREILSALHSGEAGSQRGLARELGLAPSTVNYHLGRLSEADLVAQNGDPAGPRLTELGRRVLDRLGDR